MKYYLEGTKELKLNRKDIVASGGEGTVYSKNKTAYKIYHESAKAVSPLKIAELQVLQKDTIISPGKIITDQTNRVAGYSMPFVKNTHNLCRLFARSFQKKNRIGQKQLLQLIEGFKRDLEYVHSKNILIVDLNEMNFLADNAFRKVYFIDVDSYKTPSFNAPVIMDSIRDRHSQGFSQLTDWFSWAIVTFQLLTGIHPYKGKHSQVKTLDERMIKNISVFNSSVRLPGACADLNSLPDCLQKWYYRLFEKGARENPPSLQGMPVINSAFSFQVKDIQGSTIKMELVRELKERIVYVEYLEGKCIIKTETSVVIEGEKYPDIPAAARFTGTSQGGRLLACWLEDKNLQVYDVAKKSFIPCIIEGEQMISSGKKIFIKSYETIVELTFLEAAGATKVVPRAAGQVMMHSTRAYEGVYFQNMLETCFAVLFPGQNRCYQIKIDELAGYRIIDAVYDNRVLMVVAYKDDLYDRFILRFDDTFSSYDVRKVKNVEIVDLNLVVLDHGVGIYKNDEEKLELFSNRKDAGEVKTIGDPALLQVTLYREGTKLLGSVDNKLYKLSMQTG